MYFVQTLSIAEWHKWGNHGVRFIAFDQIVRGIQVKALKLIFELFIP